MALCQRRRNARAIDVRERPEQATEAFLRRRSRYRQLRCDIERIYGRARLRLKQPLVVNFYSDFRHTTTQVGNYAVALSFVHLFFPLKHFHASKAFPELPQNPCLEEYHCGIGVQRCAKLDADRPTIEFRQQSLLVNRPPFC